ncbi:hypothetical protein BpHYR1_036544 [Brachionus plicatilis]|uniref:Uncharacterized protein n=1 Tax=Brachionus plicatilis TaxID=10195 RepID=A0A3M7RWY4_BRAPC|nr:hypothetical protein BpHYR1_036544 [Brachionus plicatilis]
MNFAVSISGTVFCLLQIFRRHGNHARLFFQRVHILDHAIGNQILPFVGLEAVLILLQLINVLVLEQKLLLFDNQERSTDAASVRVNSDLSFSDLPDYGHLGHNDVHVAAQLLQSGHQMVRVSVYADPAAVHEHFGRVVNGGRRDLLQILHAPLFQKLQYGIYLRANRNVGHESQIFDQADGVALGRLGRTNNAPLGVVQLARLGQFAVAANRRVHTTQMRQSGRVRESVEHLGDAGARLMRFLLVAPVAGRQRVLEAVGYDQRLDRHFHIERLTFVQVVLGIGLHLFDESAKEAPEEEGKKRTGQVEPLVADVIAVVELASAQRRQQQPMDHVAEKIGFF